DFEHRAARLEFVELCLQSWRAEAVRHDGDQSIELAGNAGKVALLSRTSGRSFGRQAVPLRGERTDELRHEGGIHQLRTHRLQDQGLEFPTPDALTIAAQPLPARGAAREIVLAHRGHHAAAAAANHLPGEHPLCPPLLPKAGPARRISAAAFAKTRQPCLDPLPDVLVNNPQTRDILDDPLRTRVHARHPAPCSRVFYVAHAVPNQSAGIELVAQDAGAAQSVSANGGIPPGTPIRAKYALRIQRLGNGQRAITRRKAGEDPPHDNGLTGIDGTLAAHRFAAGIHLPYDRITERPSARRLTSLDAAAEAAPGLVGEIAQEQRVHRPFEADMQLSDLALGEGDDADAGEPQALEQRSHVFLVAAQPVQGLRDHNVKCRFAGTLKQGLVAWAQGARTAEGGVAVHLHQRPALHSQPLLADADLILDRRLALVVTAIASVDDGALGHGASLTGFVESGAKGSPITSLGQHCRHTRSSSVA